MYLTAHHVVSNEGHEGINAFAHLHGAEFPSPAVDEATIELVADDFAGELADEDAELRPGGNAVRSYLDVVTPDHTDPAMIRRALGEFASSLETGMPPIRRVIEDVGIRLGMNLGLHSRRAQEFAALRERVLRLLDRRAEKRWRAPAASV